MDLQWIDEPWVLEMRRANLQIMQDFPGYVKSLQEKELMAEYAGFNVHFDELVHEATISMRKATYEKLTAVQHPQEAREDAVLAALPEPEITDEQLLALDQENEQ